jgi:MFS family permease
MFLKPRMTGGRWGVVGALVVVALVGGIASGALMEDGGWQWLPYAITAIVTLIAVALVLSWSQPGKGR